MLTFNARYRVVIYTHCAFKHQQNPKFRLVLWTWESKFGNEHPCYTFTVDDYGCHWGPVGGHLWFSKCNWRDSSGHCCMRSCAASARNQHRWMQIVKSVLLYCCVNLTSFLFQFGPALPVSVSLLSPYSLNLVLSACSSRLLVVFFSLLVLLAIFFLPPSLSIWVAPSLHRSVFDHVLSK